MPTLVHLIYIHGFQGNDTTFQSFPKDLQEHIVAQIPEHLDIQIQSSLYPTYKSIKPISYATKNFLEWLTTQPPGPVILLGHSMGGLLAADAATDPSNNPDRHPGGRPKRIVGVIAFDTPYLGMHPHVVISGIASLLPKSDEIDMKGNSESAMNEHPQVNIVDENVTDDWAAFKKQAHVRAQNAPYASSSSSRNSQETLLSPSSESSASFFSQSPNSSLDPPPLTFVDRALSFIAARNDDPFAHWLRKHHDDPISAAKRWVIERFQFGICMFDPAGLKARYARLVKWEGEGGLWINYWTKTIPVAHHRCSHVEPTDSPKLERINNDEALLANGIIPPSDINATHTSRPATPSIFEVASITSSTGNSSNLPLHVPPTRAEAKVSAKEAQTGDKGREKDKQLKQGEKARAKAAKQEEKKGKTKAEHHFVVLPNGFGQVLGGFERWENVAIEGVEDEVNAHTGLFIPHHNLDYKALVDRVSTRILGWCEILPKT